MKKVAALISFLAILSFSSSAMAWSPSMSEMQKKDKWSGLDSTLEVAYFLAHAADWGQTLSMASQCGSGAYYEANPILGECPSTQAINAYFLGTALVHAGISYILPKKYRSVFQTATIAAQIGVVSSNSSVGIKIRF